MRTVSRKYRPVAVLAVACLAAFAINANAANLLIKKADGSTATPIPLISSNGCNIVADGDIEVRPQASAGTSDDGWCPQGSIPVVPVITPPLVVSPTSIAVNGTVNATWGSTGATSCTGSATIDGVGATIPGWTGSRATAQSSPGLALTLTSPGVYVFRLICSNSAGDSPVSTSLSVTVGAQSCDFPPSFGLTRQTVMTNTNRLQGNGEHPLGSLAITDYGVIAGPWPARNGNGTIAVKSGQFVALAFNTGTVTSTLYGGTPGNPNRSGAINTALPADYPGQELIAISKCPGDFEHLPQNNVFCRNTPGSASFNWSVASSALFSCHLQENTTYYLNVAYVDYLSGGTSTCVGEPITGTNPTSCHWLVEMR